MSNHDHLFISPTNAGDRAHAMKMLNQRYVAAFNRRHRRTGTLWEGRFRSCLVDTERYALRLYQYIDLNPVRAAMVEAPEGKRYTLTRVFVHSNFGTPVQFEIGGYGLSEIRVGTSRDEHRWPSSRLPSAWPTPQPTRALGPARVKARAKALVLAWVPPGKWGRGQARPGRRRIR